MIKKSTWEASGVLSIIAVVLLVIYAALNWANAGIVEEVTTGTVDYRYEANDGTCFVTVIVGEGAQEAAYFIEVSPAEYLTLEHGDVVEVVCKDGECWLSGE